MADFTVAGAGTESHIPIIVSIELAISTGIDTDWSDGRWGSYDVRIT